jgi:ribosomal protein S18 acetylase RimI-like enzyme
MNEMAITTSPTALPAPRRATTVRTATMADLPFMDGLQKQYGKALGYFPTKQFEGYIEMGGVLLAAAEGAPVGYCISRDRYLKRDELGVIYQLCVSPGAQRGLIGASLVKEVFERSAYGCRLYCCWCAQDLAANHFWESMGFCPIAFRAGSTGKKGAGGRPRVHIFWQRRIVEGDATPWWYPCQTNAGAIRQDRLVFPIPLGTHWKDIRPPDIRPPQVHGMATTRDDAPALPPPEGRPRTVKRAAKVIAVSNEQRSHITSGGLRFAAPHDPAAARAPRSRAPKPAVKIDPKLVAAARELRDRYLEHVNGDQAMAALATPRGKYDLARTLAPIPAMPLLKAG